ncbi:MAG TPA: type II secretion system F family protein [Acidimicrobiales bacterium]|nr:type II secretion system F family protein [Acidimicrobiales bacterium]
MIGVAAFAGALAGLGVWVVVSGLRPQEETLAAALGRFEPRAPVPVADDSGVSWDNRLGRVALRHVPPLARLVERARADLRILGRRPEDYAGETAVYGLFGFMLGPWLGASVWVAGAPFPAPVAGAVSLVAGAAGLLSPWLTLRDRARARRAGFLHALIAYCQVTAMSLAAGRGVEQALTTAASAGEGWAFTELRAALNAGYVRGETPWESLARLGVDLGTPDLAQLASTIAMAGEDGAAVRETIATKARTISNRIGADAEQATQRATAQMGLPAVAIAAGFLVFLMYPALSALGSAF